MDLVFRTASVLACNYDTFDRLVTRTPPYIPFATNYLYDGTQVALSYQSGWTSYLWGQQVDELLAYEMLNPTYPDTAQARYVLPDHLGTAVDITGASSIANHRGYDSFGNLTGETNSAVDLCQSALRTSRCSTSETMGGCENFG